jgi:hypothetical protein
VKVWKSANTWITFFLLSSAVHEATQTQGKFVITQHLTMKEDKVSFEDNFALTIGLESLIGSAAEVVCIPVILGKMSLAYTFVLKTDEQEKSSKRISLVMFTFLSNPVNKTEKARIRKLLSSAIPIQQLFKKDVDI